MDTRGDDSRLRELFESSIALNSELSLETLLQKVVETAAALTDAQYAALGVIDELGDSLERFVTTGIDADTYAAIGDLPRGRGILGVLIRDARPLRLSGSVTTRARSASPRTIHRWTHSSACR